MEIYDEIKARTEDIFDDITNHIEARWNLGVLNASEKAAEAISSITFGLIIGAIGAFILLFLSLGVAWLIGQSLNNLAAGFFIVAAFYALVGGILFMAKDTLVKVPVINMFIKKFYYEN